MSETLPERSDLRQLRTQAKELLKLLQQKEPEAIQVALTADSSFQTLGVKLADAQRVIARKYGFPSWPKLVEEVETPKLVEQFISALQAGDTDKLESLLKRHRVLRARINEPVMSFDSPPIVQVSRNPKAAKIIPILVRYGADPNARSKWWAGGFSALDGSDEATAKVLLELGAMFDVWSAAAHGRLDVLKTLLDSDPDLINAPGGDGETPLHFASNPEVATFLIQRGADLEARDVDHESTPIQYQIQKPEVARVLLNHGAIPDVFTAVALNDPALLTEILATDPDAAMARVGKAPFVTVKSNGGHIYTYNLSPRKTPQQLAIELDFPEIQRILSPISPPIRRLVAAAWQEDEVAATEILKEFPDALATAEPEEGKSISDAAMAGKAGVVKILLEAGFDPLAPGMDSGTSLHVAAWFGYVEVVRLLVNHVPLDLGDAHHDSPPLGWALHGSQWCRNPKGDYLAVVQVLLDAGADPTAVANNEGTSLVNFAGEREDLKNALKAAITLKSGG